MGVDARVTFVDGKTVWADIRKTPDQLRPGRMLRRLNDILQTVEKDIQSQLPGHPRPI